MIYANVRNSVCFGRKCNNFVNSPFGILAIVPMMRDGLNPEKSIA